ncbi:hypothetical protein [Actinopolyspora mortivallis]|uniref:Uncharacterized protein n=1 Tax=Actinopolyspora mortivallis TaxID=33906 RepID=A0A2T0GRG3_ACTMO|nr:hypothetical protein [Actinopolyspora mortivallis]PRW61691.1 hypothetical protein CEP50_19415 [Actinopolyspora mortivallis]
MLEDIRARLQQILDTAPAGELQAVPTTLDELRGQLHQLAAPSTNEDIRQALRLSSFASDTVGEAVQTLMLATEHVRSFSTVL